MIFLFLSLQISIIKNLAKNVELRNVESDDCNNFICRQFV